jgi:formylglycine-generating enzyme required for sulfatase activity
MLANDLSRSLGLPLAYRVSPSSVELMDQNGVRLPYEAEWMWAASAGGVTTRWAGTDDIAALCKYAVVLDPGRSEGLPPGCPPGRITPQAAGGCLPNAWGFFDLSGNASELVWTAADEPHPRVVMDARALMVKGELTTDHELRSMFARGPAVDGIFAVRFAYTRQDEQDCRAAAL